MSVAANRIPSSLPMADNSFSGIPSMFRRPVRQDASEADVAILGVPFDHATSNRPGTRFGPRGIRAASLQMTWENAAWRWNFDPLTELNIVDLGDFIYDQGNPVRFRGALQAEALHYCQTGALLLGLGGDHFVSYPLLKAHAEHYGPLALVQFDAHSDTWIAELDSKDPDRVDHGTMFRHAVTEGLILAERSIQIGIRSKNPDNPGIRIVDADWVHDHSPSEVAEEIAAQVGNSPVYLTFDIDCLDPAFAPGTGTPVCGGLSTAQAERILCKLAELDIVGMDIVEVSPPYDVAEITSLAAATLALDMLGLAAIRKHRATSQGRTK